ncbi:hypothetical protein [Tenacibaculum geojense]|uniref:Transmembrane protein n=1 Tax=Tenacibaculum geojense TaxID=915352 RepID=A0ABW3JQA4_9FLAO
MKPKTIWLIFYVLLIFNFYKSYGCSCSHDKITQEIYDNYSLIFIGEIIEVEDCDNLGYQKFTFQVENIFKGQTTKFISGLNNCGGVCNFLYEKGQKWLIYSNPSKYGLINDSYLCNQSIIINDQEERLLLHKDYNNTYKNNLESEISFLKSRKTDESKIVNFQFIQLIPVLKNILILGIIILLFFLSFSLKIKILPYSIGLGIISGLLIYNLVKNYYFTKLTGKISLQFTLMMIFILLSNLIYFLSTKENIKFKKSLLFSFYYYVSSILTTIYILIANNYINIQYDENFYTTILFIISLGLLFSISAATLILLQKKIILRKK